MSANSPEPEIYFPKKGEDQSSMIKALDNMIEKTPEEMKKDRESVDKGRIYQPKKGKKDAKPEIKIEDK